MIASCDGDTPESAAREAAALVKQGYRCLKIKVARGSGAAGAAADADRVEAIREAVGPDVALRCDANRGWSLNDALAFGLRAMRFDLQYVEEPVQDIESDLAAFHCTTGVPVALDESVDDALLRARHKNNASVADALEELFEPTFGVVALVLKPGVLGVRGVRRRRRAARAKVSTRWSRRRSSRGWASPRARTSRRRSAPPPGTNANAKRLILFGSTTTTIRTRSSLNLDRHSCRSTTTQTSQIQWRRGCVPCSTASGRARGSTRTSRRRQSRRSYRYDAARQTEINQEA